MSLYDKLNEASNTINKEEVANALFNITDVRDALRSKELLRKLHDDGSTDATIGEILDDVILFLETLEASFEE